MTNKSNLFLLNIIINYIMSITTLNSSLRDDWYNVEKKVEIIANFTLNEYFNLKKDIINQNSMTLSNLDDQTVPPGLEKKRYCSMHSCLTKYPKLTCHTKFNSTSCLSCLGYSILTNTSKVEINENGYKNIDKRLFVRVTENLDDCFIKNNDEKVVWQYFGGSNEAYRRYPFNPSCRKFDVTKRFWYRSAAYGSRNIIILLDIRLLMEKDNMPFIKKLLKILIENTTTKDKFNIVSFYEGMNTYLNNTDMVSGGDEAVISINDYWQSLYFGNNCILGPGISSVLTFMKNLKVQNKLSEANTYIIVFSSGLINSMMDSEIPLIKQISNYREANPDINFSISFIDFNKNNIILGNHNSLLQEISCTNKGLYLNINSDADLYKLEILFLYMRIGNAFNYVSWTSPYEDGAGLGKVITATLPIYDNTVTPAFLLGVIGTDVLYEDHSKVNMKLSQFGSIANNKLILNECQINQLREHKCSNTENYNLDYSCDINTFRSTDYYTMNKDNESNSKNRNLDHSKDMNYMPTYNITEKITINITDSNNQTIYLDTISFNYNEINITPKNRENLTEIINYFKTWPISKYKNIPNDMINNIFCHPESYIIDKSNMTDEQIIKVNKDACCSYCGLSQSIASIIPTAVLFILVLFVGDLIKNAVTCKKFKNNLTKFEMAVKKHYYKKLFHKLRFLQFVAKKPEEDATKRIGFVNDCLTDEKIKILKY